MLILLLTHPAVAWDVMETADGAEMRWAEMPVTYHEHVAGAPDVPGIERALHEAFGTWNRAGGTEVLIMEGEGPGASKVALDGIDSVFFDPDWPWDRDQSMALTTVWSDEWGNIVAYDVRINGNVPWGTTPDADQFDLQAAVTHEVGHVLGLDHSSDPDATMFAEHGPAEDWRRALHDDDLAGAWHLYGEGNFVKNGPEAQTVPELLGCATVAPPAGLLALLLPLLGYRRTR